MDDYLQQGIHGVKETKPDERRRFLGTIRERVVVALTQAQVAAKNVEPEVERLMDENRTAHLYLNGNMTYSVFSKYIEAAKKKDIAYTMVTNKEHDSDLGLVLAHGHAIDKEDIFIEKKGPEPVPEKEDDGVFSQIKKKLFGNDR